MTITRENVLKDLKKEIERIKTIEERERKADSDYIEEGTEPYDKYNDDDYREPLSIEKEVCFKVLLSYGGGSDGFKLYFKDKELIRGVYYLADWGEYEEISLNEDELNLVFDFYMFGEYPEQEG